MSLQVLASPMHLRLAATCLLLQTLTLDLRCPSGNVSVADMVGQKVTLVVYMHSGGPSDFHVEARLVGGGNATKGAVWAAGQAGFVRRQANKHDGSVRLSVGHSGYSISAPELVRLTAVDRISGVRGSCVVHVGLPQAPPGVLGDAPSPALAVVSLSAAAAGNTLGLLGSPQCGFDAELPFAVHPTGLRVDDSEHLGALVGNTLLCLFLGGVLQGVAWVVRGWLPSQTSLYELIAYQGFAHAPSTFVYVFTLMYQGNVFVSQHLVVYPRNLVQFSAGLAGLLLCVLVPAVLVYRVRGAVPARGVHRPWYPDTSDPALLKTPTPSLLGLFLLGPGEWVATRRGDPWPERHMSVVKPYRQTTSWYSAYFFLIVFAVAALAVPNTSTFTECGHLRMGMCLLLVMMTLFVAWTRPYCRHRDNMTYSVLCAIGAVATGMQGVGYYHEDLNDPLFSVAADVLQVAMVFVVLKAVVDLVCDVYVVLKNRRRTVQEDVWVEEEAGVPTAKDVDNFISFGIPLGAGADGSSVMASSPSNASYSAGMFEDDVSVSAPIDATFGTHADTSLLHLLPTPIDSPPLTSNSHYNEALLSPSLPRGRGRVRAPNMVRASTFTGTPSYTAPVLAGDDVEMAILSPSSQSASPSGQYMHDGGSAASHSPAPLSPFTPLQRANTSFGRGRDRVSSWKRRNLPADAIEGMAVQV